MKKGIILVHENFVKGLPHEEIASCVWNFSVSHGLATGHSYGWPELIECWIKSGEPEPMSIDCIITKLSELND